MCRVKKKRIDKNRVKSFEIALESLKYFSLFSEKILLVKKIEIGFSCEVGEACLALFRFSPTKVTELVSINASTYCVSVGLTGQLSHLARDYQMAFCLVSRL